MRILYIEDDQDDAKLLCQIAEEKHHTVDICQTVDGGFKALSNYSYDILIVDQCLPIISGSDFIKSLTALPKKTYIFTVINKEMIERLLYHAGVNITGVLSKADFIQNVRQMIA